MVATDAGWRNNPRIFRGKSRVGEAIGGGGGGFQRGGPDRGGRRGACRLHAPGDHHHDDPGSFPIGTLTSLRINRRGALCDPCGVSGDSGCQLLGLATADDAAQTLVRPRKQVLHRKGSPAPDGGADQLLMNDPSQPIRKDRAGRVEWLNAADELQHRIDALDAIAGMDRGDHQVAVDRGAQGLRCLQPCPRR